MKKLFTSAMAGMAFTASGALAGEKDAPPLKEGRILWDDPGVTIVLDPTLKTPEVNEFLVICPGLPVLDGQFSPEKAVVGVFRRNTHEDLWDAADHLIKTAEEAGIDKETAHFPAGNYGLIRTDGTLKPAYTIREGLNMLFDFLKSAEPLPHTDATQPALIERLRSHTENFCFARF